MATYVLNVRVMNDTNLELKPMGIAFYPDCGETQQKPNKVASGYSGAPFVVQKSGESGGLWGCAAYSTPDPGEILIIYFAMPEESGALNRCWVGTVPAGTVINPEFVVRCYKNPFLSFSEKKFIWEFTAPGGGRYALVVTPSIQDPHAYNTSLDVKVRLYQSVL